MPRILGVLCFLNRRMQHPGIALVDKRRIVSSLAKIIELLQCEHLTTLRHNFISTLKIATSFSDADFPLLAVEAWLQFAYK